MGKIIQSSVDLDRLCLTKLPDFLKDVVVEGDFYCHYNSLTSLKGSPEKVEGRFYCHYNYLTSLEGAPEKVGESFHCFNNPLTSLEGLPKEIGRNLFISFAPGISFTEEEIRKVSKIKGGVYIR
jgi:hypothetical protein